MNGGSKMDLSSLHNPYDFANPILDESLFVGRKSELNEIKYYLDHAKGASRPINLAILGPRASGKTSILNMADIEAKKRGFCTIRIDLDEGDVETQMGFFYKVFDGIFSEACECGAFGGKDGKTYDAYLDIVNTYQIPEDKLLCPCLFPLQYAKAMSAGNIKAKISDYNFKSDLIKIRSEIKCPIVVLFDEGNVLANQRIILEKIRNYFMNISGYMLVITGTPELFPIMDEVFSPIIRQFKKINVRDFQEIEETSECIRRPLEKLGINPEEIFYFETLRDVEEIHNLSGGRPYEIQLICHKLFQRVQLKKAAKMMLDLSVLEDVRKELETSQDISIRPILNRVRNLGRKELSCLRLLCSCNGRATFDQLWTTEYIFNDEKRWTKEKLQKILEIFVNEGIVAISNGLIKFAGDDFDKIYTKYYGRENRVNLQFRDENIENFWNRRISSYLRTIERNSTVERLRIEGELNLDVILKKMAEREYDEDIFVKNPPGIIELYWLMIRYRKAETVPLIKMDISLPWLKSCSWYFIKDPNEVSILDKISGAFGDLAARAEAVGGKLISGNENLPINPNRNISR